MTTFSKEIAIILGTGTAVLFAATTYWYRCKKRNDKIPDQWTEVGAVSDLWIYPLKSGRGIELEEAECTETGLTSLQENKISLKDRGLLVYNEKDAEQRTARNYPKLVLITVTAVSEDEIKLEAPDTSSIVIKVSFQNPKSIPCTLWFGEPQQCIDCGNEAAKWISQYCSQKDSGLRLGLNTDWKRSVTAGGFMPMLTAVYDKLKNEDLGIYSDIASYLIVNQASVNDLNEKLPTNISPLNFRPNIILEGPDAFAEDDWDWIKIGENIIFRNIKPCTRCTFIDVDPETGIRAPEQTVLKKLREYRLVTDKKKREIEGESPMMGIYVGIRKLGHIKRGDKVYVG